MKRVVFLSALAIAASGMAWADLDGIAPKTDAVNTLSTEARYSAGRFSSDADSYIDPRYYDPEIGTFLFLGGFPSAAGSSIEDTDVPAYALSLGLGHSFESFYLGLFYGGSFVQTGSPIGEKTGDATWTNNLALLIGMKNMGIRIDIVENGATAAKQDESKWAYTDAPAVAVTWGTVMGRLAPYVTVGLKLPDTDETAKISIDGRMSIAAGAEYELNNGAGLGGEVKFATIFADNIDGTSGKNDITGFGLNAYYSQTFDAGVIAVGIKPKLDLELTGANNNGDSTDNGFTLGMGLDAGIRIRATEKLAFYTGAGLTFFELTNTSNSKDAKATSSTEVTGITWNPETLTGTGNLGFGMTIAPTQNVVIGAGLNTIVDKLFTVNLKDMKVSSGTWWGDAGRQSNMVGAFTNLFDSLEFDLTLSVKFGGKTGAAGTVTETEEAVQ
jgi:hypothetical protein